jgi:hypothetical protein
MVEYGAGVSEGAGTFAGSQGHHAAAGGDWGGNFVNAAQDTVHTVMTLPPGGLLLLIVVIVGGLFFLKRAF